MEHAAARPDDTTPDGAPDRAADWAGGDVEVEEAGPDRDLAALQALESELASLEGELDRIEGSGPPAARPDAAVPDEPSA